MVSAMGQIDRHLTVWHIKREGGEKSLVVKHCVSRVCIYSFHIHSKEGGLRPPSISPCGAGVLAPDCRGPSAPSSQSLRTSYKVGHYCVYPVTLCKSRRTLNGDIGLSVNCFVTRKSNQSRCIERRIDGLLSKMVFVVKLHLQLSQLLLYICSSYICSCNISG